MQILHCFVNNVHVDYAELLWEGLYYALEHPSTLIPYPRFIKLIVGHYITAYPKILRRVHDKYHNLEHDEMVKNVPSTQSQPIKSTQGTHWTTSAPRLPYPDVDEGGSSAQQKSIVIRLLIPPRRSTQLTPPTPVSTTPILTVAEVEDIIVRYILQLNFAEQKSHDDFEAKQNVEKVKEHLIAEEIEKIVEGSENIDELVSSNLNSQNDPDTRSDPRIYKESLNVEKTVDVQPVNVIEEEEESPEDDYELRRRVKRKEIEDTRNTPSHTTIRSPRIHLLSYLRILRNSKN
ncbi:hypothetical protein Tco_0608441 [Tanacetum coccineum]